MDKLASVLIWTIPFLLKFLAVLGLVKGRDITSLHDLLSAMRKRTLKLSQKGDSNGFMDRAC